MAGASRPLRPVPRVRRPRRGVADRRGAAGAAVPAAVPGRLRAGRARGRPRAAGPGGRGARGRARGGGRVGRRGAARGLLRSARRAGRRAADRGPVPGLPLRRVGGAPRPCRPRRDRPARQYTADHAGPDGLRPGAVGAVADRAGGRGRHARALPGRAVRGGGRPAPPPPGCPAQRRAGRGVAARRRPRGVTDGVPHAARAGAGRAAARGAVPGRGPRCPVPSRPGLPRTEDRGRVRRGGPPHAGAGASGPGP